MFKVGDFAVWDEESDDCFTHGKAYEVRKVDPGIDDNPMIQVLDNNGRVRLRYTKRFKKPNNEWLCVKKGAHGVVGMAYTPVRETDLYLVLHLDGQDVLVKKSRFVKQEEQQPVKEEQPKRPAFLSQLEEKVGKGFKMKTVSCYAVFKEEPSFHTQDVCHARLKGGEGTKGAATWIASKEVEKKHLDTYKAYVKWVVQDSSFKRAFIQNMPLDVMMVSGVELDVTQPASIVYTGAIALRMFHEHKQFREVFHNLYNHGFDIPICFLVASGYKNKDSWQGLCDWHSVLDNFATMKRFKGAMNGKFVENKPFNKTSSHEDYFCRKHFQDEKGESINTLVKRMIDKRFVQKIDMGWAGRVEATPLEFAPAIAVLLTKEYVNA